MSVKEVTLPAYVLHLSTLEHTHVDMLGPHASYGGYPKHQSPVPGDALTRGPRVVYPFDRHRKGVDQWTYLLV